jgi:predicted metal-dependent phosphoesterase TrpH
MNEGNACTASDPAIAARIDSLLVGAIDLHCHSGPSVMPRMIDHIEALEEASAAGMRALLFKDHFYSATPVTALLSSHFALCCPGCRSTTPAAASILMLWITG